VLARGLRRRHAVHPLERVAPQRLGVETSRQVRLEPVGRVVALRPLLERADHRIDLGGVDQRAVGGDADDQTGLGLPGGARVARQHVALGAAMPAQPEPARELHERLVVRIGRHGEDDLVGALTRREALELALEHRAAGEIEEDFARQARRGHARLDDHHPAHRPRETDRRMRPPAHLHSREFAARTALIVVDLTGKTLLVTGATGSFGTAFMRTVLDRYDVEAIRAFSRDELKQSELARTLSDPRIRLLIGDVRDRDRLRMATRGVDVIVHAAALKQVPACEYNPFEAVQTNVMGAENVITAAIDNDVPLTIALSTDKAVNPVNLYGATKLCAEKIVSQANVYAAGTQAKFASVRYGNVVGSRGSVIPIFKQQARTGTITITDERKTVGIRPGEKLHEVLVTEDEARHCYDIGDRYVILPQLPTWHMEVPTRGERLPDGFRYSSDSNEQWLGEDQLREMADALPPGRREADRRGADPGWEA
jgi:UDP-N-acetylglucosamine 4,6-dehydratase